MIQMHGKNRLGEDVFGCPDHCFEDAFIGVTARTFGKLDDKGRFALNVAAEQAKELFHIVNVIGAHGEPAISHLVKLSRRHNHAAKLKRGKPKRKAILRSRRQLIQQTTGKMSVCPTAKMAVLRNVTR
jgi:hypothetical protein